MPKKSHIVAAAIAAYFVQHDIRLRVKSIKAGKAYIDAIEALSAHHAEYVEHHEATVDGFMAAQQAHGAQLNYLIDKLNENGIAVDEFDIIALNFHHM